MEALLVEVDDEVLVLDVAVYNAGLVDRHQRVDDVTEPLAARQRLLQGAVRRYVVKQILASRAPTRQKYLCNGSSNRHAENGVNNHDFSTFD